MGRRIVRIEPGVDNGQSIWKLLGELVVVGDDQVDPVFPSPGGFLDRRDAAVYGDHQGAARRLQLLKSLDVEAISFFDPVRNVGAYLGAQVLEHPHHQGRCGLAVDVVVAKDADDLPGGQRPQDPVHRRADAREAFGVRQAVQTSVEELLGVTGRDDAPARQELRDKGRVTRFDQPFHARSWRALVPAPSKQ